MAKIKKTTPGVVFKNKKDNKFLLRQTVSAHCGRRVIFTWTDKLSESNVFYTEKCLLHRLESEADKHGINLKDCEKIDVEVEIII